MCCWEPTRFERCCRFCGRCYDNLIKGALKHSGFTKKQRKLTRRKTAKIRLLGETLNHLKGGKDEITDENREWRIQKLEELLKEAEGIKIHKETFCGAIAFLGERAVDFCKKMKRSLEQEAIALVQEAKDQLTSKIKMEKKKAELH